MSCCKPSTAGRMISVMSWMMTAGHAKQIPLQFHAPKIIAHAKFIDVLDFRQFQSQVFYL